MLEDTPTKAKASSDKTFGSQVQRSLWEEEEVGGGPWKEGRKNEKEGKMKIGRRYEKEGRKENGRNKKMGGRERRREGGKEERKDPILDEAILKNSYSICTSFDALRILKENLGDSSSLIPPPHPEINL
ncbi:Scaffold attachment factor B1, partial [Ophiophagus hannah]